MEIPTDDCHVRKMLLIRFHYWTAVWLPFFSLNSLFSVYFVTVAGTVSVSRKKRNFFSFLSRQKNRSSFAWELRWWWREKRVFVADKSSGFWWGWRFKEMIIKWYRFIVCNLSLGMVLLEKKVTRTKCLWGTQKFAYKHNDSLEGRVAVVTQIFEADPSEKEVLMPF